MKNIPLQNTPTVLKLAVFVLVAGLTFASCDTVSQNGNSSNTTQVALRFKTTTGTSNSANFTTVAAQQGDTLTIVGNNGTLKIADIHFIVDDFELEKAEEECKTLEGKKEETCEEFEKSLFFVDLPLANDSTYNLVAAPVKKGVYTELEFEIDDLDLDEEEDSAEVEQKKALLAEIQQQFMHWPESASMAISGVFKSNRGQVTEFTTYAEAEVSIETQFEQPLKIKDGINKRITININPEKWFVRTDGTVVNLANYDYSLTDELLNLEVKIENGFHSPEIDND